MSYRVRNVLVFPAGTEVGQEIFESLKYCKEARLFGAGQNLSTHARFSFSKYFTILSIYEAGWIEQIVEVCRTNDINYIFPAHDDVIVALSRAAAQIPAVVLSPSFEACEVTRSKSATYRALAEIVPVPTIYSGIEDVTEFPVLVKPDRGQGSFGVTKVDNATALKAVLATLKDPIVCEYLPGSEYTIDCFSDRERGVLFAGARERRRTRNGIAMNTVTVSLPEAEKYASLISFALGLRGAWFFQLKRSSDGVLKLLEVAPRIAGSMAAHRVRGVNFPLLTIFEHERLPLSINVHVNHVEMDRALKNRYKHGLRFSALYVDLDDTLILNEMVNLDVIALIFKCINERIPVKLLTRHSGDLEKTLARYRLTDLFDDVIHIGSGDLKSAYIEEPDAILIDDSYRERLDAAVNKAILTFDCSMIDVLIAESASKSCLDV